MSSAPPKTDSEKPSAAASDSHSTGEGVGHTEGAAEAGAATGGSKVQKHLEQLRTSLKAKGEMIRSLAKDLLAGFRSPDRLTRWMSGVFLLSALGAVLSFIGVLSVLRASRAPDPAHAKLAASVGQTAGHGSGHGPGKESGHASGAGSGSGHGAGHGSGAGSGSGHGTGHGSGQGSGSGSGRELPKTATLLLGMFTVDIKEKAGTPQYPGHLHAAELEVVVQCDSIETRVYLEEHMIQVRNQMVNVLSDLAREDLMSREGKRSIRKHIADKLNAWLPKGRIEEVYFSRLLIL
jgi:hypothetical protein